LGGRVKPLIGPKDPDASRFIYFNLTKEVARANSQLVVSPPPTITEVDELDAPVAVTTLTFGVPIVDPDGMVAVMTSGGIAGTRPFIRCRYAIENTETDDATLRLAISHK
jgi:hypothetical protein